MLNIVRRLMDGEEFYTNMAPRICHNEIKELSDLGFRLQVDHSSGAQVGPIAVYLLIKEEFEKRVGETVRFIEHHAKHGDMDGHICLLAKCLLHYPVGGGEIGR
jgi:hypothetical protein